MDNELYSYSEEELIAELERRKQDSIPKMLVGNNVDTSQLQGVLRDYVESVANGNYHHDDDWDHWIYEAAVEAFYGKKFWDWFNKVVK